MSFVTSPLSLRQESCLNGWWDFQPLFSAPSTSVPKEGWSAKSFLVPSFWTKPADAVRKKGEKSYKDMGKGFFSSGADLSQCEFLFDSYGYPVEWAKTRSAWLRRELELGPLQPGRRRVLRFDAVTPRCWLYVNGFAAGSFKHPTLPFEIDATPYLKEGVNEIALLVLDYEKDERGRALSPSGNWIPEIHSGVWQDVFLTERSDVFLSGVCIRTSVRKKRLDVLFELRNDSPASRRISVSADVAKWRKGVAASACKSLFELEPFTLELPPFSSLSKSVSVKWSGAELWSPERPALHLLRSVLTENGVALDSVVERFGFREVWIDGPDLMLNGHPVHLFSDWGHKTTPCYFTEAWIRKWFGMIRDANMNHSRLHTHPHPKICLELADEEGILITAEAGLHGSGGHQASDSLEYWANAEDHVRRFVSRDRNHPSIILWSVENEMRWNGNSSSLALERLPLLRRLFNELDPTRPAYHEGDSSLWDERKQPLVSRHYDKPASGCGWRDRSRPLHSGEMASYHYSDPKTCSNLAGDAGWRSFKALDEASALDSALIVEAGRAEGVCCFGPWNLSCLENLRLETEPVKLSYPDWSSPGVKPLFIAPHSSEFSFWKPGKGYFPNWSFPIQANSFRPLAVIDRSMRSACFAGDSFKRELFAVNDTVSDVEGVLSVALLLADGSPLAERSFKLKIPRGRLVSRKVSFKIPSSFEGLLSYRASFEGGSAKDSWFRKIKVSKRAGSEFGSSLKRTLAVFGDGSLKKVLTRLGVKFSYVKSLEPADLQGFSALLVERGALSAGSSQNLLLKSFAERGGALLLMEQKVSPFKDLPVKEHPLQTQFVRAFGHPALEGLSSADFMFWGDDPYPLEGGDNYVVAAPFFKDFSGRALFLLDGDEGGRGRGGMETCSLLELEQGRGLLLASQLLLSEKLSSEPAAERLFLNLLRRICSFAPVAKPETLFVDGSKLDVSAAAKLVETVAAGSLALAENSGEEVLRAIGAASGLSVEPAFLPDEYQIVRVADDPLLNGLSNEDSCGIESYPYASREKRNTKLAPVFIKPAPGLESLMETATESCAKELFVENGKSEPLRTHTQSRFLHAEKPERALAFCRLKIGAGSLLLLQFAPAKDERSPNPRFERFIKRLRANLGRQLEADLLSAPRIEAPADCGPGYPEGVFVMNRLLDEASRKALVDGTLFFSDGFGGRPLLSLPGWKRVGCPGGELQAKGLDLASDVHLYFRVDSPTRRKNVLSNLGVPNPDALSFLDLEGEGAVELLWGGASKGELKLEGGKACFPDLALELGGNHAVLRWKPLSEASSLKIRWRDIKGLPERGFSFS